MSVKLISNFIYQIINDSWRKLKRNTCLIIVCIHWYRTTPVYTKISRNFLGRYSALVSVYTDIERPLILYILLATRWDVTNGRMKCHKWSYEIYATTLAVVLFHATIPLYCLVYIKRTLPAFNYQVSYTSWVIKPISIVEFVFTNKLNKTETLPVASSHSMKKYGQILLEANTWGNLQCPCIYTLQCLCDRCQWASRTA